MITSFSNPLVKQIKRLRQRKHRQEEGAFWVEGLRVTLAAVEHNAPIDTLVYAPELLRSEIGRRVVAEQQARGIACVEVAAAVFEAISERDNPTGLGAIVQTRWQRLDSMSVRPKDIFVTMVGAADPGNVGAIVRTMDAVGAVGLILAGRTTDPFHPTAVKASMGTLFTVPLCHVDGVNEVIAWAKGNGLQSIATSAHAPENYWEVDYRLPALVWLGSEGEGLPQEILAAADVAVTMPMRGTASSLNVAVAAGLILYELRRRK